jgi:23S rRNA-intervening sequence protein
MAIQQQELPLIQKTYDLLLWLTNHIITFPRSHKFNLGDRMERHLYGVLENLLRAKFNQDRVAILQTINLDLEIFRFQLRLARDQKCLSLDSYGFAIQGTNEIGQMVGGWLKKSRSVQAAATGGTS